MKLRSCLHWRRYLVFEDAGRASTAHCDIIEATEQRWVDDRNEQSLNFSEAIHYFEQLMAPDRPQVTNIITVAIKSLLYFIIVPKL